MRAGKKTGGGGVLDRQLFFLGQLAGAFFAQETAFWTHLTLSVFVVFFKSADGWVKTKFKLPHFHVSNTCPVSIQPDAPVATAAA